MKIKSILIIRSFFIILFIYILTTGCDDSGLTPFPTPTTTTPIPETLYISGNLFNESGTATINGYKVTCTPQGGTIQTVTTDIDGLYKITAPGGAQDLTFEVRDEDDLLQGTFQISVKNDGSLDLSEGISVTGTGFNPSIPCIRTADAASSAGFPQANSDIPAGTSAYKEAILEVVHRSVIERLVKVGRRINIFGPADKYTISMDGPDGGSVIYTILADETNVTNQHYAPDNPSGESPDLYYHYNGYDYYNYPAPTSDPAIFRDRIHLFRFNDYEENGLKIKGNVAFVYGYEDYASSYDAYIYSTAVAWGNKVGWWGDPAKGNDPTWAHYTLIQEMIDYMTFVAGTAGNDWKNNIWEQFQDVVSLKYWPDYVTLFSTIVPAADFEVVNKLKIKDASNNDEIDLITVSFDVLNQKTAIAKKGLSANDAALQYQWKDELELSYHFASDGADPSADVLITELTGPGIYKRTYSELMDALTALSKTPGETQSYTITGPQGGDALFTARKALVPGSDPVRYNVLQTHTFDSYAVNDLVLNGEYSYLYETDDTGQYTKAVTIPGTVESSGYFNSIARHRFIIDGSYQHTTWYFVDDYADSWQRTPVILPLTY